MRRLAMEVSTASSFALFVFCTILLSVEVLQVYASLDPSLVYSNTTTLNFTAMTILSNSLGITPGATSLPDTVLSSLWSLEDTSTSNDEKCAVFKNILSKVDTQHVYVPKVVNKSITLRPDLASTIAADSAITFPLLTLEISEYAVSTLNASMAKLVIQEVVQNVQSLQEFKAALKPASIFAHIVATFPHLRNYMIEALKIFQKYPSIDTIVPKGNASSINLPGGKGTLYVTSRATVHAAVAVEITTYDCKYVSTTLSDQECYSILPHLFASPLVFKFKVVGGPNDLKTASSDVKCMRSATEVSNDWDYIPCTIISGYAYYTGTSFSVFSTALVKSKDHSHVNRYTSMENEFTSVVSLTRSALTNDIIGRKPTSGYRSLQVLGNSTETIDQSESGILSFSLQGRKFDSVDSSTSFAKSFGLYYSDGHAIYRSSLGAVGGVSTKSTKLVAGIATFSIHGANFGDSKKDVIAIYVGGIDCAPVTHYNASYVECITGNPSLVQTNSQRFEVVVQTRMGNSTSGNMIRNYKVRLSEGYTLPIVLHSERKLHKFRPQALLMDRSAGKYIYWSDIKEKKIRRARYDGSNIEVVSGAKVTQSIRGMAFDDTSNGYNRIYATDDNVGSIVIVPTNDTSANIQTLISGLKDPRGIALDLKNRMAYFTELTGRIYMVSMDGLNLETNPTKPAKQKLMLVRRPSNVRMNGITLDLSSTLRLRQKMYWSESNTNTIMRSTIDGLRIETIAGMDTSLVFPNSVIFDGISNYLYFSEYLGAIYRFDTKKHVQGNLNEPIHELVLNSNSGQSSIVRYEIMDISRVGGQYFFSIKD